MIRIFLIICIAVAFSTTPTLLADPICGDWSHLYPVGDLNKDCKVNFKDIAILAEYWLEDTRPW